MEKGTWCNVGLNGRVDILIDTFIWNVSNLQLALAIWISASTRHRHRIVSKIWLSRRVGAGR
jgi:hypothetical protein